MASSFRMAGLGILLMTLCGMTGCASRVALTQSLLTEYSVTESELLNLQYYVSDRVDLRREDRIINKAAVGDMLKGKSRIVREHVFVEPGTPGIAEAGDYDNLYISFERGSGFDFLWSTEGSQHGDGRYFLKPKRKLAAEERLAQSYPLGMYVFEYRGKEFFTQETRHVWLEVKLSDLMKIVEKRHRLGWD